MLTECNQLSFDFQPLGNRQVTARFDGGRITSDAGGLLLREVERQQGLVAQQNVRIGDERLRNA